MRKQERSSYEEARKIVKLSAAEEEGIFAGTSSGLNITAAIETGTELSLHILLLQLHAIQV